jgi:zinc protease
MSVVENQMLGADAALQQEKVLVDFSDAISSKVLSNGLMVVVIRNTTVPKVLVQVAYDIGSAVEQDGERGLAHLLEHMIFKGTDRLQEGAIEEIARKYGAAFNAFTAQEVTSYYFSTDNANWKPFLSILADCMQNCRLDSDHLASEMRAVVQELKMRNDNALLLAYEHLISELMPADHPYHSPIIGYKSDLAGLSSERLKAFYKKNYHPGRAVLFIAGDVEFDDAFASAEEAFKDIPAGSNVELPSYPPIVRSFSSSKTTRYENVKTASSMVAWRIPSTKERAPFSLIANILGSGTQSRLIKRMVDGDKIADTVSVATTPFLTDAGMLYIYFIAKPGMEERCVDTIVQELSRLGADGITAEEQKRIVTSEAVGIEKMFQMVSSFISHDDLLSILHTRDSSRFGASVRDLAGVTSEQVKRAVSEWLRPDFMARVDVKPLPSDRVDAWNKEKERDHALEEEIFKVHTRKSTVVEPVLPKNLAPVNPIQFSFPQPSAIFTMDNGLEVIVHENKETSMVSVQLGHKDTYRDIGTRKGQLNALLGKMLTEGTITRSKDDIGAFFESRGMSHHMGGFSGLAVDFEGALEVAADCWLNPLFDADDLEKVKEQLYTRFKQFSDSQGMIAERALASHYFAGTELDYTLEDILGDIEDCSVESIKKLHAQMYQPQSMVFIVSGNVSVDRVKAACEKHLASWKGDRVDHVEAEAIKPVTTEPIELDISLPRDQTYICLCRPSDVAGGDPDALPLMLSDSVVFQSLGSRIFKLREQSGLFYSAGGGFSIGRHKEPGFDKIVSLITPHNLEKAEAGFKGVLDDLKEHPLTEQEIDNARKSVATQMIQGASSADAIAAYLMGVRLLNLNFDYYDSVLKRTHSISADEVNRVLARYASSDGLSRIRVGRC